MTKQNLLVGLDIGTTKIASIVGEENDSGLDIVGIGTHPSNGLRKGVVINIEATVDSIKQAVEEAELMAGCEITSVFVGIAGGHIRSLNSQGTVAIKDREVSDLDVARVLDTAQAVAIPMDRELIHIIPQEYIVDDLEGIKDPRGMRGVRLSAKVHIVTGAVTSAQNIVNCCNKANLNVRDIVLEQLASSEAALTPDERDLGVMLVDIGGGTTDIAVFIDGAVVHTSVLALGGDHITHDIAYGLRTPGAEAEKIKQKYGSAMTAMVDDDSKFEVESVGGSNNRSADRATLAEIIEPRVTEILQLVQQELVRTGLEDHLPAGVVLTGGSVILPGIPELAERLFGMPARRGVPMGVGGLTEVISSPIFATGVGLVKFGQVHELDDQRLKGRSPSFFDGVKDRMKEWSRAFF